MLAKRKGFRLLKVRNNSDYVFRSYLPHDHQVSLVHKCTSLQDEQCSSSQRRKKSGRWREGEERVKRRKKGEA